jgi:hypothetical protein
MTELDEDQLRVLVLDASARPADRIGAMATLRSSGPARAVSTLLEVAGREEEPVEILKAAGIELARAVDAGASVSEFDMRDMSGPAYEGFCEWQP